jgi:hypothetical protein
MFTLPDAMTREEAFDRLKKNSSKCPSVKDVCADPAGNINILILNGKFNKYELGIIDNDAKLKQRQSLFTLIPTIISIGVLLFLGICGVMYYTVGVPYEWLDFLFISIAVAMLTMFPSLIISTKECNKIFAYIKQELGIT